MLDNQQLLQIKARLVKCGIESPELLGELTDHYAHLIEEKLGNGETFDQAFGEFVRATSWRTLRKLQWNFVASSERRLYESLLKVIKDLVWGRFTPLFAAFIFGLWHTLFGSWSSGSYLLIAVYASCALVYVSICISVCRIRLWKYMSVANYIGIFNLVAYLLLFPFIFGDGLILSEYGLPLPHKAFYFAYYVALAVFSYTGFVLFRNMYYTGYAGNIKAGQ